MLNSTISKDDLKPYQERGRKNDRCPFSSSSSCWLHICCRLRWTWLINDSRLANFRHSRSELVARLTRFEGRSHQKVSKGSPLCLSLFEKSPKKMIKGGGEYWLPSPVKRHWSEFQGILRVWFRSTLVSAHKRKQSTQFTTYWREKNNWEDKMEKMEKWNDKKRGQR